jgi:predicted RNase H-like nuclease (RuvC/YqgF family)
MQMTKPSTTLVIGFDILPQSSPSSRKSPRYAMALKQGDVLKMCESIRRNELLAIIRKEKPDIVATDNILELAPTEKNVITTLSKLPSRTRIVQVTGSPIHGMTSLTKLAKKHGLDVKGHPSSLETAIIIAELASFGVGTEIAVLARETRITVARARNIGPGGFSQARYQRRMHGAIRQVARKVLEKLDKRGMDYDKFVSKTAHGWSRCSINVYESFDTVNQFIHSEINRTAGISVTVKPVKHRSIIYLPKEGTRQQISPRRLLMVGIDAGTTVGIAIADIRGNLVALKSGRGLSRGNVIRHIVEYGHPILIASDVVPAPSFVEKLSASLQTHLFAPEKLLSVAEKRSIAKTFDPQSNLRPSNSHQRDALAAISKAFQAHGAQLKMLHKRIEDSEQNYLISNVVSLIFQGISLSDALNQSVLPPDTDSLTQKTKSSAGPISAPPSRKELLDLIERLERKAESLQRRLDHEAKQHRQSLATLHQSEVELKKTKRQLKRSQDVEQREHRLDDRIQRKNAEIQGLRKKNQLLRNELEKTKRTLTNLRLMRRLEIRGEVQPVLILPLFSQEEIRKFVEHYPPKKSKVVYILDPSGGASSTANQLIQFGVQVVITHGTMSHLALDQFHSAKIPVLNAENLEITIVDEFAVVDIHQLTQEVLKWRRRYLSNEREATADALERLIEEYRQERRNGISKEE